MLNNEKNIFENYESPIKIITEDITHSIIKKVEEETDDKIVYAASLATEIKIDADELKKAMLTGIKKGAPLQ